MLHILLYRRTRVSNVFIGFAACSRDKIEMPSHLADRSRANYVSAMKMFLRSTLAAMSGNDNVSVKPLVKHVLSKELQLYFERICSAILDEQNDEYRNAAYTSLSSDTGK